ncbi:MAG: ABC transporter permease subunit [Spirochaetia bacterium]|jgi:iron(III) transport system permease protein|nr:ABC transporter permease subunit [Spirochaetia bacterium]
MSTISTNNLQSKKKIFEDKYIVYIVGGLIGIFLLIFLALPVLNIIRLSLTEYLPKQHEFTGKITLANFIDYFKNPSMVQSLLNSLWIAIWSMLFTTVLAFIFAYGLTRTTIRWKKALYYIAMVPLVAPSMLQAMALISLFGSNGLITAGLLNTEWNIYGPNGIIISEVLYCFPHAMVILYTTLSAVDSRLDEAAASLGASGLSSFFKITIPTARYGIFSAAALVFNLAITDFGNPIIIGRGYKVLSTEIYLQVIGMQRFDLGTTVAVILMVPSILAFLLNYYFTKKSASMISSLANPEIPPSRPAKKWIFTIYSWFIAFVLLSIVGVIVYKSFVKVWMYNWTPTLSHFNFRIPGGMGVLWTSLWISLIVGFLGAFLTMLNGYIIEKKNPFFAQPLYLFSIIPAAIPGLVMGLGYILIFNTRFMNLDDILYGMPLLIIINVLVSNFTLGTLSSITNMKNIDNSMDEAATSLGAGITRTFMQVIFPLSKVSFMSNLIYYFMRSMVTVSAVIFLISPDVHLAAVSVINLEKDGKDGSSAAMSTLIMLVVILVLIVFGFFTRKKKEMTVIE